MRARGLILASNAYTGEFARGLATYSAEEVERIKGRPTAQILAVLGFTNGDEVIHRDDLVLLPPRA